jgi:hypothetical protein
LFGSPDQTLNMSFTQEILFRTLQVQKSAKHYTEAAMDEITLLTQIRDGDPHNNKHCVHLLDWFEHVGPHGKHVCMVFEVSSSSSGFNASSRLPRMAAGCHRYT